MPSTIWHWIMFAYFTIGAAGGIAALYLIITYRVRIWRAK